MPTASITSATSLRPIIYIGIDPGVSGGLAVLTQQTACLRVVPMPDMERDIWAWIRDRARHNDGSSEPRAFAVIEKVGGFMGARTGEAKFNRAGGHTMFTFGQSYGGLRMALIAADIEFQAIPPAQWQRGLEIPSRAKKETKQVWKNRLKAIAQAMFPREHITLATADAVLLAEYCRRMKENLLSLSPQPRRRRP